MLSSSEQKPAIDFDNVKKLDSAGKLDVAATLGEIIKATFNQAVTASPEAKDKSMITGTLRVMWSTNRKEGIQERLAGRNLYYAAGIYIESDNPHDPLHQLTPWLGTSLESSKSASFLADLKIFDRQFILPYLKEFKNDLKKSQQ